MATAAEVAEYSSAIDSLTTVAYAQIKALLQALDTPNPIAFRDALLATYPELMAPFLSASSEVAAVWYSALRSESGTLGVFRPVLAKPVPVAKLEAEVRYSLSPLFQPQEFVGSTILELLAGVSQKLIANQGRDTITGSAFADPARVGYARVPQPGCCAFCGMLASRGAVYSSRESASGVIGRGVDASTTAGKRGGQGRGVRARGLERLGNRYHNHCRCVPTPVFPRADNSYVEETTQKYTDMYQNVESRTGELRPLGGAVTAKDVFADWRHTFNTK